MRHRYPIKSFAALALSTLLALGAAACDDPTDADEDHGDPEGLLIIRGSEVLVTELEGQVTGVLHLHPGETTPHLTVAFTDDDGDPIVFDSDFYLEVHSNDPSVADFLQDTPGEFGGHARGLAEGTTTFVFRLMHGAVGSGHPDWESRPVPVEVEDDDH